MCNVFFNFKQSKKKQVPVRKLGKRNFVSLFDILRSRYCIDIFNNTYNVHIKKK